MNKNELPMDEDILNSISTHALNVIKTKGPQMDEEIQKKLDELEDMIREGYSHDGCVTVKIDGNHQILDISIEPTFNAWKNDSIKTCALIAEAVNDAIYKVDLGIETEITSIQYKFTGEVIDEVYKPEKIKNTYKQTISEFKDK